MKQFTTLILFESVDLCYRYDPKNLDAPLGEMTMMNSKCELYLRFLKRRVTVST